MNLFFNMIKRIKSILFGNHKGLYYVNGPQTLPPPLSKEDEAYAIEEMENDPEKRMLLIEHNLRLVVYIAKKLDEDEEISEDDWYQKVGPQRYIYSGISE